MAARITRTLSRSNMRFTIHKLMLFVSFVCVCAFCYSWHCWYSHEIANFELNNGYSVRFWTEYRSWRGAQRQLSGGVYNNGNLETDLSIFGKHYSRSGHMPKAYFADSNNLVYIRYPGPCKNYVVGDLNTGEFIVGLFSEHPQLPRPNLLIPYRPSKWKSILHRLQTANPNETLF